MGMGSLSGIRMLVHAGSVKSSHSVGIPGEMGRNPVQDHTNPLTVHIIHKVHEIVRSSIAAGRRIISCYLVAPGGIQRMLHHWHELYVGVAHILYIIRQFYSQLPVIIELRACNGFTGLIFSQLFAHPGTKMNLINIHRLRLAVRLCPFFQPFAVIPLIPVYIPYNGSVVGPQLPIVGIGIRL